MVQNFVRVRQEYKHIIVKGAGGLRGETGPQGPEGPQGPQGVQGIQGMQGEQGVQGIQGPKGDPGAGLVITGSVNTYADLPNDLGPDDAGEAFFVQADGKLYVWSGTAWPADGEGSQFEGPQGPQGVQGPQGIQGPQGEPGTDANVVNTLSQSTTDAYSAKYINDNNYTKTETDTLLNAKAPANEVAYIGQEVAGGSTLIGTSDIAPGAITTTKVADGAITSDKIDWTTIEDIVTNTNGTAIKYQNGIMVAYKNFASGTLTTDGTYGVTSWTYPVAFVENPCVQVSNTRESNNYSLLIPRLNSITSSTYQATWTKVTSLSTTLGIINTTLNSVSFYAIGRWK